jgi:hypothetical protein
MVGTFKTSLGTIVKPLGHPTEMVKTKSGENQIAGNLVVWDRTNGYFKLPATSATSKYFGMVVLSNLNGTYDGQREVIFGHGTEVWVTLKSSGAIIPGDDVIFSTTVAGSVETAATAGTDAGTDKLVGKFICKASEFWKDNIANAYTNAALNDNVIVQLLQPRA